jgi:nucleoside-diphosphate-sugar epimerase
MKVLLTGSSGFLGSEILKYFIQNNIEIKTLGRSLTNNIRIDLTKDTYNNNINYDLIIHAAGKAHDNNNNTFHDVNYLGTKNLLNSLITNPPKSFVFISTVAVYGRTEGELISENHPLNAIDDYGKSKIEAEKLIINWCNKFNVCFTILRLPLIVGQNPPGNLKKMINAIKNNYFFTVNGGTARKSMVLAADVAKYILISSNIGGIYNLTDGTHPSFRELSCLIAKKYKIHFILNIPTNFINLFYKFNKLCNNKFSNQAFLLKKLSLSLTFDDEKARSNFNWSPSSVLNVNFY